MEPPQKKIVYAPIVDAFTEVMNESESESESEPTATVKQRHSERESERERERDGSPDLRCISRCTRAVSPLPEKDAAGTPEVPAPVLHREGLFSVGPLPTEHEDDVHLAGSKRKSLLQKTDACRVWLLHTAYLVS